MNKVKYTTTLGIIVFILNLIWENTQASLFAGYQSFSQHFPVCLIATVGDVSITFLVLAFLWLLKKAWVQTAADFVALAIIGFFIAIVIEQHALLLNKWNYSSGMPLVPWLKVGLLPIMQMTILLPLSFYITGLLNKKS